MKIKINEVWNAEGRSETLAIIDVDGDTILAVKEWIEKNRPDLQLALGLSSHGYHARQVL